MLKEVGKGRGKLGPFQAVGVRSVLDRSDRDHGRELTTGRPRIDRGGG